MSLRLYMVKSLREARENDDDWTGMTDPAERRRRQNRLHQRAWRRRKAAEKASGSADAHATNLKTIPPESLSNNAEGMNESVEEPLGRIGEHVISLRTTPVVSLERLKPFSYWEDLKARSESLSLPLARRHHTPPPRPSLLDEDRATEKRARPWAPFIPYLPQAFNPDKDSVPRFIFPLSPDHELLVLTQYNTLRGIMTNFAILGFLERLPLECGAVLYLDDFPTTPVVKPPSLQETWLQQTTPHDMWIDMIPIPRMRDNLLALSGVVDEDEFCEDAMGGLYEGYNDIEMKGILIWGDPWCETSWEISQGFASKYPFLLRGCDTLIEASNRYRESRGEDRLVIEI